MTTIIAVENSDHVLMGSDSQVTQGLQKQPLADGKIFSNGPYTFGVAGRFRLLQLLQHMELPEPDSGSLERFLSTTIVPLIEDRAKEAGAGFHESAGLVAIKGQVYEFGGDGSVIHSGAGIYSIGSGSTFALGALSELGREPTKDDVLRALRIASQHDAGTSGPFWVKRV